jgi:hypothetical protein
MKNIDAIVLKALLLMEDEEDAGKLDTAPEKDVNAEPGSFEADPMEFILKKYVTLNSLLEELMTPSFRDYVDAIFIVAPKPTTFKILLHNGQYFFLTFLGKAYEATINGRNYYLVQIGEKERCMIAISKLLRFGSPLKTKGPEGSEQGTRDEMDAEAGDMAEETPEETPAEPESLEESIKILTNILLREAVDKDITSNDSFLNTALSQIEKLKIPAKKINKDQKGWHIRGNFGQPEETEAFIEKVLSKIGIDGSSYKIEYIEPKDFANGSKSASYRTYVITCKKSFGDVKKGDELYVISTIKSTPEGSAPSVLVGKDLTPVGLGVSGEYTESKKIIDDVNKAIKAKKPAIYPLLHSLIEDVKEGAGPIEGGLTETKTKTIVIGCSDETIKNLTSVSESDISTIGKDFGEILGGIFLSLSVGIKEKLIFPKGNEPLVDFYLDGYKISSKYKKGAAASITDLVKKVDPTTLTKGSDEDKFYNSMKQFTEKGVTGPDAFLNVAKIEIENMPAINQLATLCEVTPKKLDREIINNRIHKIVDNKKSNESKTRAFKLVFGNLFKEIGHAPSGFESNDINWDSYNSDAYYGLITSGFSYYVCDRLNEVPIYLEMLKEMVSKTGVKQMYLTFSIKQKILTFAIKSFNDPNAQFEFHIPSISSKNPTSSKLGFKLI